MSQYEEELQKQVEENRKGDSTSVEVRAYRAVFRALDREPKISTSSSLAVAVITKIVARKKRETRRDLIWLTLGVVFLMIGLVVTGALAGMTVQLGFLKDISAYFGVFIFGILMIFAFNVVEKKVLEKSR